MRNMVSEGLGVAVVPEIALRGADSSRYSCVRLVDQWCNREFKILWNNNVSQSTAVMRLLRHLRGGA
jgi:DNA-binding transcriptional LysR family regulator